MVPAVDGNIGKKYSAGRLLLEWLFRDRVEASDQFFDFTIGAEDYKSKWCNDAVDLGSMAAALSLRGCFSLVPFSQGIG